MHPATPPQPADTLRYALTEIDIGTTLVATSATGIAAILIGDDPARLIRELRRSFPTGDLVRDDPALAPTIAAVAALIADPLREADLALDLRGSELELAVWEALRRVPAGETVTYGAIARALPVAATAQEVGAACAANRIAVAVPCHRVVKADGSISGYRWGVDRKRQLLRRESLEELLV